MILQIKEIPLVGGVSDPLYPTGRQESRPFAKDFKLRIGFDIFMYDRLLRGVSTRSTGSCCLLNLTEEITVAFCRLCAYTLRWLIVLRGAVLQVEEIDLARGAADLLHPTVGQDS